MLRKMTSAGFQFSPGVFTVKDADPEETLERFEQYVKAMRMAFGLNSRVDPTTDAKVEFDDTDKKNIIQLEGGHDMMDLFEHVGKVKLSPRQRLRRQSLARNKKKQWGAEWMLQL